MRFSWQCPLQNIKRQQIDIKSETAEVRICRFLYIVGIQSIRILKRVRRRLAVFLTPFASLCHYLYSISIARQIKKYREEILLIRQGFSVARKRIRKARRKGFFSVLKEMFCIAEKSLHLHKSFLLSLMNMAAPVLSVILLILTVQYWGHLNYGLILENNGEQIATIQDESIYEAATQMVNQRMVHDSAKSDVKIQYAPNFRLSVINGLYSTAGLVCDKLIQQSNGIIEEASGLYVDGELLGVIKSGADMRYMLQNILNAASGNHKEATAQFTQNVEIVNGLFPTTSIISSEQMNKTLTGTSKEGVTYTVKEGDTVTSIAKANHTTISDLNKINDNQLGDSIHPGDLVNLEVAVPRLSVEIIQTIKYQPPIAFTTITKNDDAKYTDYTKVITQGSDGLQECTDKVYVVNGIEVKRETITRTVLRQPVNKVVLTGTKKRPSSGSGISSGSLMWPIPSLRTITTYFTWRWGTFHYGIDISGSSAYGKTIVAADGGVVLASGWDGGYGYRVLINHGNGLQTLYGHCSKLLVSSGQKVSKGQPIARVGSTGNSTGPHCHFEVRKNGTKVNPLKYVKKP